LRDEMAVLVMKRKTLKVSEVRSSDVSNSGTLSTQRLIVNLIHVYDYGIITRNTVALLCVKDSECDVVMTSSIFNINMKCVLRIARKGFAK